MVSFLDQYKVLVCAGTGGVGKTTLSASLGLLAARQGIKTLVLTIDPARRLISALGLESGEDFVKVPVPAGYGELWAAMIHPEKIFEDFVRSTAPDSAAAERLLKNPLYQQLATTLSGSQEFTSLEKVLSALEEGSFDLIILDTPPSQHAMDFLRAPQKIFNLFQDSVTKWFVRSDPSQSLWGKLFNQGTRTALMALQKVTGAKFISELSDFFESISALQVKVRERSIRLHRMLASPQTGFFLITGSDEAKLKEAREFQKVLESEGHHFSGVIVNRSFPEWKLHRPASLSSEERWNDIQAFFDKMKAFQSSREKAYDNLKRDMGSNLVLLKVPEMKGQQTGLQALLEISKAIEEDYVSKNIQTPQ